MFPTPAHIDHHTERIIGRAIEVHETFGAGLLESVYRECMAVELKYAGLQLKLANCPAGLLLNFNVTRMKAGVKRLDHPDLYTPKKKEGSS